VNKIDPHHLPPELAAQILERDAELAANPLPEDLRELLTILAEECVESAQRCTKILRFGMLPNPWTGRHNRETLEAELGDLFAIVRILHARGDVDWVKIIAHAEAKIFALRKPNGRLRHAQVPEGA
jgi:NTP pyrophosphatase (non-canonical NTP hydrolase)